MVLVLQTHSITSFIQDAKLGMLVDCYWRRQAAMLQWLPGSGVAPHERLPAIMTVCLSPIVCSVDHNVWGHDKVAEMLCQRDTSSGVADNIGLFPKSIYYVQLAYRTRPIYTAHVRPII